MLCSFNHFGVYATTTSKRETRGAKTLCLGRPVVICCLVVALSLLRVRPPGLLVSTVSIYVRPLVAHCPCDREFWFLNLVKKNTNQEQILIQVVWRRISGKDKRAATHCDFYKMNLNSPRDSVISHPISVESSPRMMETARSMESQDHNMPDLLTDGGGGSGTVTPRAVGDQFVTTSSMVTAPNDRESSVDADFNHVSETASLVDSFNQVYQKQISYYDQNFDEVEAMRVSVCETKFFSGGFRLVGGAVGVAR